VTIDGESANDQSVTIRERDSLAQVRIAMDQVRNWVQDRITV
jgi:glycyl-tRNA synthetase